MGGKQSSETTTLKRPKPGDSARARWVYERGLELAEVREKVRAMAAADPSLTARHFKAMFGLSDSTVRNWLRSIRKTSPDGGTTMPDSDADRLWDAIQRSIAQYKQRIEQLETTLAESYERDSKAQSDLVKLQAEVLAEKEKRGTAEAETRRLRAIINSYQERSNRTKAKMLQELGIAQ